MSSNHDSGDDYSIDLNSSQDGHMTMAAAPPHTTTTTTAPNPYTPSPQQPPPSAMSSNHPATLMSGGGEGDDGEEEEAEKQEGEEIDPSLRDDASSSSSSSVKDEEGAEENDQQHSTIQHAPFSAAVTKNDKPTIVDEPFEDKTPQSSDDDEAEGDADGGRKDEEEKAEAVLSPPPPPLPSHATQHHDTSSDNHDNDDRDDDTHDHRHAPTVTPAPPRVVVADPFDPFSDAPPPPPPSAAAVNLVSTAGAPLPFLAPPQPMATATVNHFSSSAADAPTAATTVTKAPALYNPFEDFLSDDANNTHHHHVQIEGTTRPLPTTSAPTALFGEEHHHHHVDPNAAVASGEGSSALFGNLSQHQQHQGATPTPAPALPQYLDNHRSPSTGGRGGGVGGVQSHVNTSRNSQRNSSNNSSAANLFLGMSPEDREVALQAEIDRRVAEKLRLAEEERMRQEEENRQAMEAAARLKQQQLEEEERKRQAEEAEARRIQQQKEAEEAEACIQQQKEAEEAEARIQQQKEAEEAEARRIQQQKEAEEAEAARLAELERQQQAEIERRVAEKLRLAEEERMRQEEEKRQAMEAAARLKQQQLEEEERKRQAEEAEARRLQQQQEAEEAEAARLAELERQQQAEIERRVAEKLRLAEEERQHRIREQQRREKEEAEAVEEARRLLLIQQQKAAAEAAAAAEAKRLQEEEAAMAMERRIAAETEARVAAAMKAHEEKMMQQQQKQEREREEATVDTAASAVVGSAGGEMATRRHSSSTKSSGATKNKHNTNASPPYSSTEGGGGNTDALMSSIVREEDGNVTNNNAAPAVAATPMEGGGKGMFGGFAAKAKAKAASLHEAVVAEKLQSAAAGTLSSLQQQTAAVQQHVKSATAAADSLINDTVDKSNAYGDQLAGVVKEKAMEQARNNPVAALTVAAAASQAKATLGEASASVQGKAKAMADKTAEATQEARALVDQKYGKEMAAASAMVDTVKHKAMRRGAKNDVGGSGGDAASPPPTSSVSAATIDSPAAAVAALSPSPKPQQQQPQEQGAEEGDANASSPSSSASASFESTAASSSSSRGEDAAPNAEGSSDVDSDVDAVDAFLDSEIQKTQQQPAAVETKSGTAAAGLTTTITSPTSARASSDRGMAALAANVSFGPDGMAEDPTFYHHSNGIFDGPSDPASMNVSVEDVHRCKQGIALAIEALKAGEQQQSSGGDKNASSSSANAGNNGRAIGAPVFSSFEATTAKAMGFPSVEASAAAAASQLVVIENFQTVREEGRCPDAPVDEKIPYNSFVSLQNNFFKASQFVVGLPSGPFNADRFPSIPLREPARDGPYAPIDEPNAKSFSEYTPMYESALVKREGVDSDDDDGDENGKGDYDDAEDDHSSDDDISDEEELLRRRHERAEARTAARAAKRAKRPFAENTITDPSDPTVVSRIGSSYLYPDPLHMWERARGKRLAAPKNLLVNAASANAAASAKAAAQQQASAHAGLVRSTFSTTYGPNTHRVYCNEQLDINAFRRPLPAVSMFNNGFLLKVSLENFTSALEKEHGAVDPLMLTFSLYSLSAQTKRKISEDFQVGIHLDQFFPHKSLHVYNNLRKFVIFVPEEHRNEPLVLFCRVHRLSCDEFANYVDLYQRPHTYQKQKHLFPMLQETQQLAMNAVAWQELGFTFYRISNCELKPSAAVPADKIFRSTKALKADELADHVINEHKLKSLNTVPITITVSVTDVSFREASFPTGMVDAARMLETSPSDTANSNTLASQLSMKLIGANKPPTPSETESLVWLRDPEDVKGQKDLCRHVGSPRHVLGGGYVNAFYNLYYLRMLGAKLSTVPACVKLPYTHRAIVIQVALKCDDDSLSEEGVPAFYGGPLGSSLLTTSVFTTTTHSSFILDLTDEFKIQLPAYLNRKHHLFFTYWAVTTKKPPPASTSGPQVPRMIKLGYSVTPLMTADGGALMVRDSFELPMISVETAQAHLGSGYMSKLAKLNMKEHAVLGGAPVLTIGASTRTSLYSADQTMGTVCEKMRFTIPYVTKDNGALKKSGQLRQTSDTGDPIFQGQLRASCALGTTEIVAYFPALCSYHIAVISSACNEVSLSARRHALQALLHIVHTMQTYDTTGNTFVMYRRVGTSPKGPVKVASSQPAARTAVANTLYTYLSNNPMFTNQKFAVAQGVAEVWNAVITELMAMPSRTADQQTLYQRLTDYSWFLLDLMLRSLYLSSAIAPAANYNSATMGSPVAVASPKSPAPAGSLDSSASNANLTASQRFGNSFNFQAINSGAYEKPAPIDTSFYVLLERLLTNVLKKEVPVLGTAIIGRVAVFLRQACVRCDRGAIMTMATRVFGTIKHSPANVQCALRIFTEHSESFRLMLGPREHHLPTMCGYFMHSFIELLKPSLLHKSREARFGALTCIYNFCVRLVNNKKASGSDVHCIATSMYPLIIFFARNWKEFVALTAEQTTSTSSSSSSNNANSNANHGIYDRRMLLAIVTWILFHGKMAALRGFLQTLGDAANKDLLAGFLQMLVDTQNMFRYQSTPPKAETRVMEDIAKSASEWESRFATFVHLIGSTVAAEVLSQCNASIRAVDQRSSANPQIYPFFLLLESIVSVNNASVSLIAGSSTLHQTSHNLFPELISGRASYMSGMILLALRLMSFATPIARTNAVKIITEIATLYHTMTGGMSRMRSNMANGLVGVAESKGRDMSRAGIFILNGLRSVSSSLKLVENTEAAHRPPDGFLERFTDGGNTQSSSSGMRYDYYVPPLPSSDDWVRTKQVADAVLQQQLRATSGSLSEEFSHMIDSLVQLFKSVLRVQQDDAMKFKESKCGAYHQIIASFFNQCVVTQGFKWLQRLHDTHRANEDNVEAALTSVVSAALAFRITEIFYEVKGRDTKGARMPFAVFSHVAYSEYLHIVPELVQILPTPAVYAMVTEMSVVGSEPVFTVEGQIVILQAAAGLLDKANYAELSLSVALLAAKFAIAKGDYSAGAASYTTSSKLCAAIASTNVRRIQHRYYLVWARMEMEQAPVKIKKNKGGDGANTSRKVGDDATANTSAQGGEDKLNSTLNGTVNNLSPAAVVDDVYTERKPLFLSEPVKRIVKVPFNVDQTTFEQQAMQQVASLLQDPSIIVPTSDSVDTLPYTKPKRRKGVAAAAVIPTAGGATPAAPLSNSGKASLTSPRGGAGASSPAPSGVLSSPQPPALSPAAAAAALSGAPINHCWLTVREVQPHLDEDEKNHLRPHQRICNAIDKTTFVAKFECTSLCGLNTIQRVNEGLAGSLKATKVVSHFDPLSIRKEHHVFTLKRSFPCATTAIEVVATETSCLDAAQTAADLIRKQTETLEPSTPLSPTSSSSSSGVNLIVRIYEALTPLGIVPAGHYYKQVALTMRAEAEVMKEIKAFIIIAKKKTDEAIMNYQAMEKHSEKCANVLKAVADMECALL